MTHPEQLIADYLDDALDDAGQVELRTWLKADTANMRRFTEAIQFEQEIRALVHAKAETESVTRFAESLAPMKKDAARPPSVIPFEKGIKSPGRLARAAVWLGAFTWFGNKANAAATPTLANPAAILSQTTPTILMTKTSHDCHRHRHPRWRGKLGLPHPSKQPRDRRAGTRNQRSKRSHPTGPFRSQ